MFKPLWATSLLLIANAASGADNCESIRAQIDAKIGATGVTRYSVIVVDAAASAPGRVVGSCDRGSKKILYAQSSAAAPAAPAAARPRGRAASGAGPIITECKDGTVSYDGQCKK